MEKEPVFRGLLLPQSWWGVPYDWMVLVLTGTVFLMLIVGNPLVLLSAIPLVFTARKLVERDRDLLWIAITFLREIFPRICWPSRWFWGANTYRIGYLHESSKDR